MQWFSWEVKFFKVHCQPQIHNTYTKVGFSAAQTLTSPLRSLIHFLMFLNIPRACSGCLACEFTFGDSPNLSKICQHFRSTTYIQRWSHNTKRYNIDNSAEFGTTIVNHTKNSEPIKQHSSLTTEWIRMSRKNWTSRPGRLSKGLAKPGMKPQSDLYCLYCLFKDSLGRLPWQKPNFQRT